ncbi:UvrD-helicase domain-containing protein [Streptomyces sp. XH2]|uniref:UvrD-helicase domain-containing protein n=1 Tax=Streptomyces sp. XH2 TaxID=3412483 RepID=UPI003C7A57CA
MYGAMGVVVPGRTIDLVAARPAEVAKRQEKAATIVTQAPVTQAPAARKTGKLKPTDEQQAVIDACAAGDDLVVEAGAGTGKTTTLMMAAAGMRGRGIYLAYNRAIAQDAGKKFPGNVDCRTAHSLAWHAIGRDYQARTRVRVPARRTAELLGITEPLRVSEDRVLSPVQLARLATEAVDKFAHSASFEVEAHHVPELEGIPDGTMNALRREVLPHARHLWQQTQDIRSEHRFTHDYYLKMWALTEPKLNVDFVLLDEAQDSNPVIARLVQAQAAQRIAVGDSAQAIYGWRGAVDALANWPAKRRLLLQQSWRFGPAVAAEANRWLDQVGARIQLVGNPDKRSVVAALEKPQAVLCRTNAKAVARAMKALEQGLRPALVGGGGQIKALAEAALDLQAGRPTSHPELIAFETWGQLQDYVDNEGSGSDLRVFVKLIDDQGAREVVKAMDRLVSEQHADVILSTAHKAKGREWGTVQIANDFTPPADRPDGSPGEIRRDEAMLAYVAVTRAMDVLDNGGLAWIDEFDTGDPGYDPTRAVLARARRRLGRGPGAYDPYED